MVAYPFGYAVVVIFHYNAPRKSIVVDGDTLIFISICACAIASASAGGYCEW